MIAEWNIRQQDAADAQRRRQRRPGRPGHVLPAPTPQPSRRRPQAPRVAMARLAGTNAAVTPDAGAFWFGKGLVRVE